MARNLRTRLEQLEKRLGSGGYGFTWLTGAETPVERAEKIEAANAEAGPDGTTIIFSWEQNPPKPEPGVRVVTWPED